MPKTVGFSSVTACAARSLTEQAEDRFTRRAPHAKQAIKIESEEKDKAERHAALEQVFRQFDQAYGMGMMKRALVVQ